MFKDKVVLITGSSQGIGKAIALNFAALGAKIALNDIASQQENLEQTKKEIEEAGAQAAYFFADISNYGQVEKMMADIQKELGGLDVLVHNAGMCQDRTLAKMSEQEWQRVISINLTGVFNCSKLALPLIVPAQGKIINISSIIGQRGNFGQTNYAAAKAGIIGFTKSLSKEVGRLGVRVNAICPGFIATDMTDALSNELKITIKRLTALERMGKPQEIADLVVFLASEKSSFITGAAINIDGGL